MSVQFDNIFHGDASDLGKLKFNAAGMGWKAYSAEDNSDNITYAASNIESAAWHRGSRHFTLRLQVRSQREGDGGRVAFEGFKRDEHDKVKRTLDEYFGIKVETRDTSLKGWNWGQMDVEGSEMHFQVQSKTAFHIPLSAVSNSNIAGKNEVAVEFAPAAAAPSGGANASNTYREPDELVEMRFYIPGMSKKKGKDGEDGENEDEDEDEDEVEVDAEGKEVTAAEAVHRKIQEHADIRGESGDSLVVFEDILVLTPRGRFSLEFYMDSIRLIGKSTDYRVPFTSIHRIFAIPKIDDMHVQLILGLDPPIRQGATRYPFLVAQMPQDEHTDAELNIEDEDLAKFPDLQRKYEDATYKVISFVMKAMTGKRIIGPGAFKSGEKAHGVKANVKAVQGELYFLEKALIFIAKQPILIDYSKTESISFSRVGAGGLASSRTFDMRVTSRSGSADHVFSAIPKEEAPAISAFLASKNVKLENEMDDAADLADAAMDEDSEDEDMDDADILSSDEERAKKDKGKKGKGKEAVSKGRSRDDDTESGKFFLTTHRWLLAFGLPTSMIGPWLSSDVDGEAGHEAEDEDFQDESSDGGSPSEDSDSDAGSDDGGGESDASDPMMEELKRKAAAKKAKKNKKDAEVDSDGEGKPKKKKPKTDD